MNAHPFSANTIFERKPALPFIRCGRAIQILEKRLRVTPRKRHSHNFRERYSLFRRYASSARYGSPSRRERIARLKKIVGDRPALNVGFRAPWTVRIYSSALVAILRRIGVDQKSGYAKPLRGKGFEAAIAVRIGISHQRDFPSHINSMLAQVFIVLWIPAMRIDYRGCHVARS